MKRLIIILMLLLSTICFASVTRFQRFDTIEKAIEFIANYYSEASDGLGGISWWSAHKIVVIPISIDIKTGIINNKYIVYWKAEN